MTATNSKITIHFKEKFLLIAIKNVTQEKLQTIFRCNFEFTHLIDIETKEVVFIEDSDELVAGSSYQLETKNSAKQSDENFPQQNNLQNWLAQNQVKVQHALVLSMASYEENAKEYLEMNLPHHKFKSFTENQFGKCRFLIAETENDDTVYVVFRGTADFEDVLVDFKFWLKEAERNPLPGSFHCGFLERAEIFPLETFLSSKFIQNKTIVICGHSLGGAISSIIYSELVIQRKRHGDMLFSNACNITFGAPFFADLDFREHLTSIEPKPEMYHIVVKNDPVPSLLGFKDELKAISKSSPKSEQLVRKVSNVLSKLQPIVKTILSVASLAATLGVVQEEIKTAVSASKGILDYIEKDCFAPLGNFLMVDGENWNFYDHALQSKIREALNIWQETELEDFQNHSLCYYKRTLEIVGSFKSKCFDIATYNDDGEPGTRTLKGITDFLPKISTADLCMIEQHKTLRLSIHGQQLSSLLLRDCQFHFSFPFGSSNSKVKKFPGALEDRVAIEQICLQIDPNFSPFGCKIEIATLFGKCEYDIKQSQIRNTESMPTKKVAKDESVSLLIKKSIQRAVALAQIKQINVQDEPLLRIVRKLANLCLETEDIELIFGLSEQVLCDEDAYKKLEDLCSKIERAVCSKLVLRFKDTKFLSFLKTVSSVCNRETVKPKRKIFLGQTFCSNRDISLRCKARFYTIENNWDSRVPETQFLRAI